MNPLLAVAGALALIVLLVALCGLAFVVGMRRRWAVLHGLIFWVSRRWLNPIQMRSAGRPSAYAGVIRHVGRRSRRDYETPVGIVPVDGGFVIALPYGRRPDWLRNVLGAGTATVVHEGRTVPVTGPGIIPSADVAELFSASDRRAMRLLRTDECLRLRVAEAGPSLEAADEALRPAATALDDEVATGVEG
jgi:deazaflavin-dependent oxidoreductase (nitroreductase family)